MNLKELLIKIVDIFDREFDDFPIHEFPELSNLTVIQAHYLEVIAKMDNPTISKITRELHVSKPTVYRICVFTCYNCHCHFILF